MLIQTSHDLSSCVEAGMLLTSSYVICSRKLSSFFSSTLLLQNQCCLLPQNSFNNATTCHICTKPFGHCHIAGSYRDAAHSECNLMYRISKSGWNLPVHNLKGYDGHLIVKALKSEFGKVPVISQNMEKYLSL